MQSLSLFQSGCNSFESSRTELSLLFLSSFSATWLLLLLETIAMAVRMMRNSAGPITGHVSPICGRPWPPVEATVSSTSLAKALFSSAAVERALKSGARCADERRTSSLRTEEQRALAMSLTRSRPRSDANSRSGSCGKERAAETAGISSTGDEVAAAAPVEADAEAAACTSLEAAAAAAAASELGSPEVGCSCCCCSLWLWACSIIVLATLKAHSRSCSSCSKWALVPA
mmetsp:Transcript_22123/g.71615  ORF Transcript_22123/g.71615 Transcript_22123/m.71615 type:complete len:230 (-) Transcript_22123:1843-2532(-)